MPDEQILPAPVVAPVIPYATPVLMPTTSDVWHERKTVIARKDAVFPPRCVKCNLPVEGNPIRRTFYWHHPGLFALILAGILVYAIIAIVLRKKGVVHFYVCPKHRQRRLIGLLLGWTGGIGGPVIAIAGAANNSGALATVGIAVFIAGIVAALFARVLYPKKIDDHFVWLSGAGPEFLQSLSEVPAPPVLPPAYPYAGAAPTV